MLISMISGSPVLGDEIIWRNGPVAIVSYEDDETEWKRRIAAACIHHHADYEHVIANLRFIHKPGGKVSFAQRAATGSTLFPDSEKTIIDGLRVLVVLLIVDPFNTAHEWDDTGNSISLLLGRA